MSIDFWDNFEEEQCEKRRARSLIGCSKCKNGFETNIKKLEIENKNLKDCLKYIENFVEFCKCGNPKNDCICSIGADRDTICTL